ncbi:hypothetical protein GIB67_005435 [Kingdonia uniflora]|uniref:Phospholipase A-2-activating protein n=1 Tax=Kingdonia uniflora TaxID=39325 RepID=A0A7J7NHM5_9MAGN|nr:hypothetical protein GIB67_005435 [Kingdonia uniflora]
MEIDFAEYKLSSELRGHEQDVRGICVCGDAGFATSSRDRTVRLWSLNPSEKKQKYESAKIMLGHTKFVGPLTWIPPNTRFPLGAVVSGGMDTLIFVWDLRTGKSVQTLKGNQAQVTGVAVDDNEDIISAAVDCYFDLLRLWIFPACLVVISGAFFSTIRRWRNGQAVEFWEAHTAAIQAIIKLPSGELVTGSSDSTLKLWRGKTCIHTFVGHTDTVRGLSVMPDLGILSASHDGSIRLWALTGELLMEMVGHTAIVYSAHAHVSGLIVSGSEDCLAKIWKDGVCVQSLEHPGCVWDAKFLENGDIVTACSDGVVRTWTVEKDRIADPVEIASYASEISQYKCSRKKVGGLKLEDLPGMEALYIPGTTDGQTKIVREGDNGIAYGWNAIEQKWDKIGEVVDGPEDSLNRPVLDGIQYDHVFDVDIGDGEPIRKLPYNRRDNPYDAADKWLLKESLPLSYRQQVVEFILQNSGQKDFALDTSFRDPYTGANAYVPGEPSRASGASLKPIYKHIPKKGMLFFDVAQFDGILKKIVEFNSTLLSDPEQKNMSLTEVELSGISTIVKILKDTSHYHCSTFADVDIVLLLRLLKSWPVAMLYPVLDVLRMVILHPDGASLLFKHTKDGYDILMATITKVTTTPALAANLLTITRAVTNLFKESCFSQWLQMHCSEVLDSLSSCLASNKNVQLSYSTLLLNYAVLSIEKRDQDSQSQVLSAAFAVVEEESLDVDSKFRCLVAVGSLMLEGSMKKIALDFDVESIARVAKGSKDAKIAEVGADIDCLSSRS